MIEALELRAWLICTALSFLACGCEVNSGGDESLCEQLGACACQTAICVSDEPSFTAPVIVAPSPELPTEARSQAAHNNLDVIMHEGRLFFAYRTAPSHFASEQARIHVVSTLDQMQWRFEGSFHEQADLREPRFLSLKGRLFLFYARLGTDRLAFEPGLSRRVAYVGPGRWSEPEAVFPIGFIPWRIQVADGVAWLMGYTGGESIYSDGPSMLDVHWLKSDDGESWSPVASGQPVVLTGGVSETAFAFVGDGTVVTVARNEAGDDGGFGSRVCHGPTAQPTRWRCADDPRKYDSPLIFRYGGQSWLIGRRHLTDDGAYDVATEGSLVERRLANQVAYWVAPKRCALWRIDHERLQVEHVLDLPTAGDTCFASVVPMGGNQFLVYDYSSPTDEPELAWMDGQNGPTRIYRTTLTLP